MRNLTLQNIAEACRGTLLTVSGQTIPQKEVAGVVIDSRKVEQDFLFFAIVGNRVDGHSFVEQVLEKGAMAAVVEKMPQKVTGPLILVQSTEQALKDLAAFYRESLSVTVVGVTGSVGKTSTKETIASVLSQKYRVLATEGNFNNEVGLPLTVFRMTEETEVAVLEMGISHFGEMDRLATIAKPDIAVITNIGDCHLEFLGSRDGVLQAKTEVFHHLNKNGHAVLNGDDEKLATVSDVNGRKPVFFGTGEKNDVRVTEWTSLGLDGTTMTICLPETKQQGAAVIEATVHSPGRHHLYNALAASAVGNLLGLTPEEIKAGIESYRTISGRSHLIHTGKLTILDDCYNANPISMSEALDTLDLAEQRKIAVLGDMGELGEEEVSLHRQVGTHLADTEIDVVFCAGELMKALADEVQRLSPGKQVFSFDDREEMTKALLSYIQEGDAILVKASHFMEFPKIVEALQNW